MSPKQISKKINSKKPSARKPTDFEQCVVEFSLKHPDFGAKRLVPLLKKEKINTSATTAYRILRRHGLQNREKRLAKLKQNAAKAARISRKSQARVSDDAAERIVEIALQNPDYGPRRLVPLLKQEGISISPSKVYTLLSRRGLNTRNKRIAELKEKTAEPIPIPQPETDRIAGIPPEVEARITETPRVIDEPASVSERIPEAAAPEAEAKILKAPREVAPKSPWRLRLINFLLLILIVYLGVQGALKFRNIKQEPQTDARVETASQIAAPAATDHFLLDYRIIWERDLFGTAGRDKAASSKMEELLVAAIPPAEQDMGLRLVGTVVQGNSKKSLAIIEIFSTRKQDAFHEGEQAGEVQIKKILRQKVVVNTERGDRLLSVEFEKSGQKSIINQPEPEQESIENSSSIEKQRPISRRETGRTRSFSLKRDELMASLADIDGLMQQVALEPYERGDQPEGIRISKIGNESLFKRIGLRHRDVITAVDDQSITRPDQAPIIFERLASGGEVTIKVRRRHRTRLIKLNIE